MGALQQVLVVDDGRRAIDRSLAAELAELGYASVTASLEAAPDVLAVIARPAAVLLQASSRDPAYALLSERLREQMRCAGIPVIVVDEVMAGQTGTRIDLQSEIGPYVLNEPDL
jgi:PleD family two-component response regulator